MTKIYHIKQAKNQAIVKLFKIVFKNGGTKQCQIALQENVSSGMWSTVHT